MKQLVFLVFATLIGATPASAHGVRYDIEPKKTVCVRVSYDDGEPMGYASAKVFSPADAKIEHQNGRTDKNGRFAFVPDAQGTWTVAVTDGMGHAVKARVEVAGAGDPVTAAAGPKTGGPSPGTALAGLSVIFFIFGALFWWKGRRRT